MPISGNLLTSITSLLRAYWSRGRYVRRRLCNKIHHRSRFCCDSFSSWFELRSFRHCIRAHCRTGMAHIEQAVLMWIVGEGVSECWCCAGVWCCAWPFVSRLSHCFLFLFALSLNLSLHVCTFGINGGSSFLVSKKHLRAKYSGAVTDVSLRM